MQKIENISILNMDLDFELVDNKYYITLLNKRLKTKNGYDVYCDDMKVFNFVKKDYSEFKLKSKWLNLVSNYIDFINSPDNISQAKNQPISYLKNDLLLYLDDEQGEYFEYQQQTYLPLVDNFSKLFELDQRLIPTTGFGAITFEDKTVTKITNVVDLLYLKDLFIASFLIRISTSSILTLFALKKELSVDEFFKISFYAELDKQEKSKDLAEYDRLNSIKEELMILFNFAGF
ncbi:MAG: hypothetical protein GY793_00445 [Proteobacteria bacterium]|nr:hypothetical protein [Pseudomonadota bacterium]